MIRCPGCKRESRAHDYCEHCFNDLSAIAVASADPLGVSGLAAIHAAPMAAHAVHQPSAGSGPRGYAPPPPAPLGGAATAGEPAVRPNWESPAAVPTQAIAPAASHVRTSLTGEVIHEAPSPAPPPVAAGAPIPPAGGLPSIYGGGRPAMAGVPAGAVHAGAMHRMYDVDELPAGLRVEQFLAIAVPIVALSMLAINFTQGMMVWIAMGCFFLVGLAMGATRAIDSFDEAFLDVGAILMACYFLGPLGGFIAYAIVCLIKQEWNVSAAAVLTSNIIIRLLFAVAFPNDADWLTLMPSFGSLGRIISFFPVACSFAGWILSNFFRPVDE